MRNRKSQNTEVNKLFVSFIVSKEGIRLKAEKDLVIRS